jgi:hypothetical protein
VHVGNVSFQPFDSVAEADESEGQDNPNDCKDEAKGPEENRENPERENCEFVHGVGFSIGWLVYFVRWLVKIV